MQIRNSALNSLYDHILNYHSVLLVGMRQVGVGGFVRSVLRAAAPDKNMYYVHTNLQGLTRKTTPVFWSHLYRKVFETAALIHSGKEFTVYQQQFEEWEKSEDQSSESNTLDKLQKLLKYLVSVGDRPILVITRFDRILPAATPDFFDNLQALVENADKKACYILTSWRELQDIRPDVFSDATHSLFTRTVFIKPFTQSESEEILNKLLAEYKLTMTPDTKMAVIKLTGGHLQFMKLAVTVYRELESPKKLEWLAAFAQDERTTNMSREIYECLKPSEKKTLEKIAMGKQIEVSSYVTKSGILLETNKNYTFFCPLLEQFVKNTITQALSYEFESTLTAKEKLLFDYLKKHIGEVCERAEVFAEIWANSEDATDWALDKLVARLRGKIAAQKAYILYTHKSRGFRLAEV